MILPDRRNRGWKALVSPQATSLLLVVAVGLLAWLTIQTNQSIRQGRQQIIYNRQVIERQNSTAKADDLRAKTALVTLARLAQDTAAQLLVAQTRKDAVQVAQLEREMRRIEADLLAAIRQLEGALNRSIRQDRQRDRPASAHA